jgi:succinate dehydrogenase / fumarate reductase iron-sulfur subunit
MSRKVKVFRFDGAVDKEGRYEEFEIEDADGMTVLDALNFIYYNIDPGLSFYGHSRCEHGICARCTVSVNGKSAVACTTPLPEGGEVVIEPVSKKRVVKDLVTGK